MEPLGVASREENRILNRPSEYPRGTPRRGRDPPSTTPPARRSLRAKLVHTIEGTGPPPSVDLAESQFIR